MGGRRIELDIEKSSDRPPAFPLAATITARPGNQNHALKQFATAPFVQVLKQSLESYVHIGIIPEQTRTRAR